VERAAAICGSPSSSAPQLFQRRPRSRHSRVTTRRASAARRGRIISRFGTALIEYVGGTECTVCGRESRRPLHHHDPLAVPVPAGELQARAHEMDRLRQDGVLSDRGPGSRPSCATSRPGFYGLKSELRPVRSPGGQGRCPPCWRSIPTAASIARTTDPERRSLLARPAGHLGFTRQLVRARSAAMPCGRAGTEPPLRGEFGTGRIPPQDRERP
jgi:hypothetical protein